MRTIKFRAWDWDAKKMIYDVPVFKGEAFVDVSTKENTDNLERLISEVENYPLMQFTGLTDKNGKECFEGDIVQPYQGKMKSGICYIKYLEKGYSMVQNEDDTLMDCPWYYVFEILGDIYTTPELLKSND